MNIEKGLTLVNPNILVCDPGLEPGQSNVSALSEQRVNQLHYMPIIYLPSWIRTKVLLACKASAITRLGEGELVLDKGFEPMTYA